MSNPFKSAVKSSSNPLKRGLKMSNPIKSGFVLREGIKNPLTTSLLKKEIVNNHQNHQMIPQFINQCLRTEIKEAKHHKENFKGELKYLINESPGLKCLINESPKRKFQRATQMLNKVDRTKGDRK